MKRLLGLYLLITAVSAAAGVSANEEVVATNPEEIVANVCAACHGQDGNAMITLPARLTDPFFELMVPLFVTSVAIRATYCASMLPF